MLGCDYIGALVRQSMINALFSICFRARRAPTLKAYNFFSYLSNERCLFCMFFCINGSLSERTDPSE